MRTLISQDPYVNLNEGQMWITRGIWPCQWIGCRDAGEPPFVTAYRKRFVLDQDVMLRVHVSADERYELFLDGERVGRGSERGDKNHWFYETYDFQVKKGTHVIVARVWSLGTMAPYAQMSVHPGFILSPEGEFIELLGTGIAEWEARRLSGYEFVNPGLTWGTGANLIIDAKQFSWGFEKGEGGGWSPVIPLQAGADGFIRNEFPPMHLMRPATLPPMLEADRWVGVARFVSDATQSIAVNAQNNLTAELDQWNTLLKKGSITLPPNTRRRVIVDLENYYCAYPEVITSGGRGSSIRVLWAESLFREPETKTKGDRNDIEGKYFVGVGDTFKPDGGPDRKFETLWWQAGRYLEILIETTDDPLTVKSLHLRETHYPLDMESSFEASDPRLARVIPIAWRGLQMCAHETYMDCPYYEQLMYVGDTRLEVLTTYTTTRDDRLPRKALRMFDASRLNSGLTQSRYPSRVTQVIPPFSLWWVAMVYDYARWRDDPLYVKSLMPGVRAVVDCFLTFMNDDGLVQAPNGWNYMDWVPAWTWGIPPDGDFGVSGVINWQLVWVLTMVAELEETVGELELSARARRLAAELAARTAAAFWDDSRSLFADDLAKQHFSEHAQCLAILSGQLDPARRAQVADALLSDENLARTTIYFMHYLFETYQLLGRIDALFDRLSLWFDLERYGLKTTIEQPEPSRSDCHAWGAHPVYHYFASILGIRPGSMGFRTVTITPQLGPLTSASGKLVHPRGEIEVNFRVENGALQGSVTLPASVSGTLTYGPKRQPLKGGKQAVRL